MAILGRKSLTKLFSGHKYSTINHAKLINNYNIGFLQQMHQQFYFLMNFYH